MAQKHNKSRMVRGCLDFLVLTILNKTSPVSTYDLIAKIHRTFDFFPSPGMFYPILDGMKNAGHVRTVAINGRNEWELTEEGLKKFEQSRDEYFIFNKNLLGFMKLPDNPQII